MVLTGLSQTTEKPCLSCMDRGPGPAKYVLPGTCGLKSHDPTKKANPSFSFGVKHKQFSSLSATKRSPGPVYFITPQITRTGKDGTPAFSIAGRPRSLTVPAMPGPGDDMMLYDVINVIRII